MNVVMFSIKTKFRPKIVIFSLYLLVFCLFLLCTAVDPQDIMHFDQTYIYPVDWDNETLTFVIEEKYANFSRKLLDFKTSDFYSTKLQFIKAHKKLVINRSIYLNRSISIFDCNSQKVEKTFATSGISVADNMLEGFWVFQEKKHFELNGTTRVVELIDINGNPVDDYGPVDLLEDKSFTWKVLKVFQWHNFTYALCMRTEKLVEKDEKQLRRFLVLIRVQFLKSAKKIKKRDDEEAQSEFFKEKNPQWFRSIYFPREVSKKLEVIFAPNFNGKPTMLIKQSKKIELIPIDEINTAFDLPQNAQLQRVNLTCIDFSSAISLGKINPCDESSFRMLYYENISVPSVIVTSDLVMGSGVFINDELNEFSILGYKDGTLITLCLLGETSQCFSTDEENIRWPQSSRHIGFDAIKGLAVFSIRTNHSVIPLSKPLISCNKFSTCSSCEMVGFYHCKWIDFGCVQTKEKVKPEANLCFTIEDTQVLSVPTKLSLKIKTNYRMDLTKDRVELKIDNSPHPVTYSEETYNAEIELKAGSEPIVMLSLLFSRKLGGPMVADFDLRGHRLKSALRSFITVWFPIFLGFCFFTLLSINLTRRCAPKKDYLVEEPIDAITDELPSLTEPRDDRRSSEKRKKLSTLGSGRKVGAKKSKNLFSSLAIPSRVSSF